MMGCWGLESRLTGKPSAKLAAVRLTSLKLPIMGASEAVEILTLAVC